MITHFEPTANIEDGAIKCAYCGAPFGVLGWNGVDVLVLDTGYRQVPDGLCVKAKRPPRRVRFYASGEVDAPVATVKLDTPPRVKCAHCQTINTVRRSLA